MDQVTGQASASQPLTPEQIFPGDSEMARMMRTMNWSSTALGPAEIWPQPLRTAVNLCLSSRSPIVLWWGPDLNVFYNDSYRPSLGASKHPALGKPGREVWPEVWPTIGPLLEGVMMHGESTWSEDQLLPLDRYGYLEEVYFTYSYTPIRLETGKVGGVFCVATETTAKVLAERRMRAGRDLAAALVDARTTDDVCSRAIQALASCAADAPFALLYLIDAEKEQARLAGDLGLATGSKLAPRTQDLSETSDTAAGDKIWPLIPVIRTNEYAIVANLATRWGGASLYAGRELTPHTAMVLPVTEPGQASPSAILVAGVSPMRALDDEYIGFYELLVSHLSSGFAAAHAYEDERRRADALAAIDRAKTTFFSNVSHEFRTPLTLLLGPLEDSLADATEPLPAHQRERLEVMRRNGIRLLKLVNTLLDFARIEADRAQASYEPIDLATYTAELASSFRSLVERAGMELIVNCPPLDDLAEPAFIDREMWEKIVLNLVSNAFKFTFEGRITIALHGVDDGRAVELEVRDTGVGIPAAELPRLFERFHRVEGARARTHEGSGIGLALVQELVHLHGGSIRAESEEGVGTSFFVWLPVGAAHLPTARVQSPSTLTSTALGAEAYVGEAERWMPEMLTPYTSSDDQLADGDELAIRLELGTTLGRPAILSGEMDGAIHQPARVVLADDNADMREYLARLLGSHYVVDAVANGAQALAAVQREMPDLVLSDVMMPELDGFGLLRALRSDPVTATVPVILLSARAGEEAILEGLEAGADDYLVKPFSAREVLTRVATRIEIARTRQARFRAEAAMHRSEGRLRAMFTQAGVGVCLIDVDCIIHEVNPKFCEIIGYEPSDLIGRSCLDLTFEEDKPENIRIVEELLTDDHDSVTFEKRYARQDGTVVWVRINLTKILDVLATPRQMVAIVEDITERKRAEEASAYLAAIVTSSSDAIVSKTLDGIITSWNASAERMFGYTAEEMIGTSILRLIPPERYSEEDHILAQLKAGERIDHFETVRVTKHGSYIDVSLTISPVEDNAGKIIGASKIARDITERKQLERRTQEALDALLHMAETLVQGDEYAGQAWPEGIPAPTASPVAQYIVQLTRHVINCDVAAIVLLDRETLRLSPLALVGVPPQVERQWWHDVPRTTLAEYYPADVVERIRAGETVVVDLQAQPLLNGADHRMRRVLIVPMRIGDQIIGLFPVEHHDRETDYSDEEVAQVEAIARFSALMIERERLLRERAEAEARTLTLSETNRRMGEFLGIASHELRTPLTSITANVQMAGRQLSALGQTARAQDTDPTAHNSLTNRLQRSSILLEWTDRQLLRLVRLVDDLLDVSRIQAGKLEMRPEMCDVLTIVRESVQEQQAAWSERRIVLTLPRKAHVTAYADADRIGQVITNYVSNALKYSPEDASVAVAVHAQGDSVRVEVRDHGPGLSPEQQAHLFERFYRVPGIEQQSGSGVGLGLGLYICKSIIERHGGSFGVESAPDEGSTFWFTLPLGEGSTPDGGATNA